VKSVLNRLRNDYAKSGSLVLRDLCARNKQGLDGVTGHLRRLESDQSPKVRQQALDAVRRIEVGTLIK
jgi:hypothetical protein